MNRTIKLHLQGPAGLIEASLDLPEDIKHQPASYRPRGIALVAHPTLCLVAQWITRSLKR